jgi:hypothetical protein
MRKITLTFFVLILVTLNCFGQCDDFNQVGIFDKQNGIYSKSKTQNLRISDTLCFNQEDSFILLMDSVISDDIDVILPELTVGNYIAFFKNTKKPSNIIKNSKDKFSSSSYFWNESIKRKNVIEYVNGDTIRQETLFYDNGNIRYNKITKKDTSLFVYFDCQGDTIQMERKFTRENDMIRFERVFWDKDGNRFRSLLYLHKNKYILNEWENVLPVKKMIVKKNRYYTVLWEMKRPYFFILK